MQLSFLRTVKAHTIFLLSFILLFTTGCDDDDHDNHDHGHTDADGFILESNGSEIYQEFEGSITGSITLSVGDTLELAVHFLDHEGNEIEHEEEGEEHEEGELEVSGANASIAIVEVEHEEEGDDHDHDEEHGAALHIIGVSSGSTSFTLQLMHDGHADYTSTNDVVVTVN